MYLPPTNAADDRLHVLHATSRGYGLVTLTIEVYPREMWENGSLVTAEEALNTVECTACASRDE